jgi:hypothetical protein
MVASENIRQEANRMQHVRVALYTITPGSADEVIRRGESGMVPIFRAQPGFVAYGLVKTGEETLVSISVWESEQQAIAANQIAGTWVRENVGNMLVSAVNHVGDLAYFSSMSAIGG